MARQKGIIKLQGTIGDITFYKTKDGHLAKEKGGIPAARIASDPAFQKTRESGSEFGRAGQAGKVLRNAIRSLLQNTKDRRVVSRLTTKTIKVIRADATSERGLCNVIDGEVSLLEGFDLNINAKLGTTIYAPFTATVDRIAGTLTANIPAFVPVNMIAAPSGTTHFKIVSAGAEIDFENESFTLDHNESPDLPWDSHQTEALTHENVVNANSTHPLFLLVGVQFFQAVNGVNYSLKKGAFNSLQIVKAIGA